MTPLPPASEHWSALPDQIVRVGWVSPLTGKRYDPIKGHIVIAPSLEGSERDLLKPLDLPDPIAIVCDHTTRHVLADRIAQSLSQTRTIKLIALESPKATMLTAAQLTEKSASAGSLVAVGSGVINDLCKLVASRTNRSYAVFTTAGSMNGYTSSTASLTLDNGLKTSLAAQAPSGTFVDLSVCAKAPSRLTAAGVGDSLCRSVAQIDWWMAHRLFDTSFHFEPYLLAIPDELALRSRAADLIRGDIEATGHLLRLLTLSGIGIQLIGTSHPISMGEHQISHYIDCFAGQKHPGSLHGHQVAVATLTMARIQQAMLAMKDPPVLAPTVINENAMSRRMGHTIAHHCAKQWRKKAFTPDNVNAFNHRLRHIWPQLRQECLEIAVPADELRQTLSTVGAPTTAAELGLDEDFYRQAVLHGHEMRNRLSFADLARDSGMLEELIEQEI